MLSDCAQRSQSLPSERGFRLSCEGFVTLEKAGVWIEFVVA